jgi:hypothetical protein
MGKEAATGWLPVSHLETYFGENTLLTTEELVMKILFVPGK